MKLFEIIIQKLSLLVLNIFIVILYAMIGSLIVSPIYLLVRGILSFYESLIYKVDYSFAWSSLSTEYSWLYIFIISIGAFGGIWYFIDEKIKEIL